MTTAKSRLSCASSVGLGAALQHLAEERATGREHLAGEFGGRFGERHDAQMVGLAMAGRVRRHVGEHHVGRPAEQRLEPVGCRRIEKVELQELDARDGAHLEQIDRHHTAFAVSSTDALGRHLAPAAGRSAEIDDTRGTA